MPHGDPEPSTGPKARVGGAVSASLESLERLLQDLQVGVVVQGPASEVLLINRAALAMLGLREEKVLGKTSFDAARLAVREDGSPFPGEDHPAPRALATRRPVRNVLMGFDRPGGERVWLLVNADPQLGPDGEVACVICTLTDITTFKRAEEKLEGSEVRFRQLVEKAQDIFYRTDVNGYFTYVNPVATRTMGYPEHELVGKHYLELIREDHRQRVEERLVRQFRDGIPDSYDEFVAVARDGREVWIGQNVQLLVEGGRVLGFQAVARDITERRRAEQAVEQERQQLREIVRSAPVAMALLDRLGRYVAHSARWPREWGLEEASLVGRKHRDVVLNAPRGFSDAFEQALAGESVSQPEQLIELPGGARTFVRWSVHPWRGPGGAVDGVICVLQNIDAFVRAREAALQASRLKSEFLARLGRRIGGPADALLTKARELLAAGLGEEQRRRVEQLEARAGELLAIVDELLDFSKAESGRLELQAVEFDLPAVLGEAIAGFAERARSKGLELTWRATEEVPRSVRGDPGRVRQVLDHLVDNAVRFTGAGAVVLRVRLDAATDDAARLRFEVTDTGPGVDPETEARLFQPFSEAEGREATAGGGTGLGLALCRRLVQAMGGEIGVRSQPGVGSTFWFTARFERPPKAPPLDRTAPALVPADSEPFRQEKVRVLVVEDNAINLKVAVAMLESLGYEAETATNGLEAVEACARAEHDAVLMDCQLPEMDGFKATAFIREREGASRRTPIIALTASVLPGDREKCLAAGMDDYLSKPVRLETLEATLRKWTEPPRKAAAPAPGLVFPEGHPLRALEAQGMRSVVVSIIDLFLDTTPLRLQDLRQALADHDTATLLAVAHSLKGAAVQLGAREIADRCARVQAAVRERDFAEAARLLDGLEADYAGVGRTLADQRRSLAASADRS